MRPFSIGLILLLTSAVHAADLWSQEPPAKPPVKPLAKGSTPEAVEGSGRAPTQTLEAARGFEPRAWTAVTGHKVTATFIEVVDGAVRLAMKDGGTLRVELSKLSPGDQQVAKQLNERVAIPSFIFRSPFQPKTWASPQFTTAPQSLTLPAFYAQHIDFSGMPIVASKQVDPKALKAVHYWLQVMTSKRPDLTRELTLAGIRIAVLGANEVTTDLPEYSALTPAKYWNERTRSSKATLDRPVIAVAEENLLGLKKDLYAGEQMVVHEVAHTLHEIALAKRAPTFDTELRTAYENAMRDGRWQKTHSATSYQEYFAEGAQIWFQVNGVVEKANGFHGPIGTRQQLIEYDPALAKLLALVFP